MARILCFGDSNTWGWNPHDKSRYGKETRWTGRLQEMFGTLHEIIEEGLNGRTTTFDDHVSGGGKKGLSYLIPCLETHRPIDLVIMMLGTNDLKLRFSLSAYDIARAMDRLVATVLGSTAGPAGESPQVLLVSPARVGPLSDFKEMFAGAREKSLLLGRHYRQVSLERGCHFLDAAELIESSPVDGIHLEKESHGILAEAFVQKIGQILQS
ncbi:hydrolase [Marispirochaeta aestuarii]|uniref:Hydrolase n=1 Tax=Marispirochaeta aestuarii TaxID=1963862 RepID=A0A1Y1RTS5_9SPIO|nr:SGNH/GDSL hydrolase family protein [Marispirochaeta aestuarii]ORC31184.1 hydrolase [Marispirochaeta aestuarii]